MPPKPGTYQRRPRRPLRPVQYPSKRVAPIELALRGPRFFGEGVSAAQWEELRAATWGHWLVLVTEGAARAWPPAAARHDGIRGHALRRTFVPPEGYIGGWDATPTIVALAQEGLAEVARFRKADPTAAGSITEPLREYARRLREVRDHPERRLRGPQA
jgi:hypothetical protein